MRYGFTTGSCAAAASKAAAYMLLTGKAKNKITIQTPKGIAYTADITDIKRSENEVSCAVIKDGGDDPDVTTGSYIYASVRILHSDTCALCKKKQDLVIINIDGGDGVGRVTKPGLDQPVGNAAINHVPREMIEKEVREVCELLDFKGTLDITISVPKGKELAERTFNPRLGIVGGISILGTSGIVEPMSSQALIDTIRVELRQRYSFGYDYVAVCLRLLFCHSHNFSILQKQIQMGLHQIGRIDHQTIFDQCFHPLHPLAFLFDRIRSLINQQILS